MFEYHFGRPVLGKILILPVLGAIEFKYSKKWACISINCSSLEGETTAKALKENGCSEILTLVFDDVWNESHANKGYLLMTSEQGELVRKFVDQQWEDVDLLVIHCQAGISRSSAIGKAISEQFQPEFSSFFSKLYRPNLHVYNLLKPW